MFGRGSPGGCSPGWNQFYASRLRVLHATVDGAVFIYPGASDMMSFVRFCSGLFGGGCVPAKSFMGSVLVRRRWRLLVLV